MGFASLRFPTNTSVANMMYDIVRTVTGQITATNSLTYATPFGSEIVNTLNENWSILYGDLNAAEGFRTAFVLTSTCVVSTKIHHVQLLGAYTSWATTGPQDGVAAGVGLNSISAATSPTVVSNTSFYSLDATTSEQGRFTIKVESDFPNVYVHWSKHHLLMFGRNGDSPTDRTMAVGSFEFPENDLTTYSNVTPVAHFHNMSGHTTVFEGDLIPNNAAPAGIVWQGIQLYNPSTNSVANIDLGQSGIGTIVEDFEPQPTIDSNGNQVWPLIPFYWSLPAIGITNINISTLSGVYRAAPYVGNPDDILSYNGENYVWLPIGNSMTSPGTQQAGIALLKK